MRFYIYVSNNEPVYVRNFKVNKFIPFCYRDKKET